MAVTQSKLSARSISKDEFEILCPKDVSCRDVMHQGMDGCLKATCYMGKEAIYGTFKFFLPIYLAQLVLSWRNLNRQTLKELVWRYLRSVVFGMGMGSCFLGSACLFHRLLGGYNYYFSAMIPGAIGGLSVFADDPKRRDIFFNTYLNLMFEYLINTFKLRLPRLQETPVFMLISAVLMYQLRTATNRSKIFWFFVPPRRTVQVLGECCPHTGPCWKDIVKGGAKYAALAVAIQLVKIFLSMGFQKLRRIKEKLFSRSTVEFAVSLGGYVFIYKVVSCFLSRRYGGDRPIFSAIAGLLAGSVYAVRPRIEAISSAVIAILTLFLRQKGISDFALLKTIHATELTLALCNGLFFHARCMDAPNCPSFIITMMDTATRFQAKQIFDRFMELHRRAESEGNLKKNVKKELREK